MMNGPLEADHPIFQMIGNALNAMLIIPVTPTEREMLTQMAQIDGMTLAEYMRALVEREVYLLGTLEARHPHILERGNN